MNGDVVLSPVPRVALTFDEAAASLGISRDHFERHVRPGLRVIESGRRLLVTVRELEGWAERSSAIDVAEQLGGRPPTPVRPAPK